MAIHSLVFGLAFLHQDHGTAHCALSRRQALNTVAVESTRGWRIAKEKTGKKIDAIVALAMACSAALAAALPCQLTDAQVEQLWAIGAGEEDANPLKLNVTL